MTTKRYVILLSAMVLVAVAAPAFATTGTDAMTVGVSQNDGVVVTVTANGTAVENASVSVSALNNSTYAGAGNGTTDENGTVALPTPANNTTVRIVATKGNRTAETTATLVASTTKDANTSDGQFGQQVSSFIKKLLSGENVRHPGRAISAWVTAHNPGAGHKSDHAKEHGKDEESQNHAKNEEHGKDHDHGHGKNKNGNPGNSHGTNEKHDGGDDSNDN